MTKLIHDEPELYTPPLVWKVSDNQGTACLVTEPVQTLRGKRYRYEAIFNPAAQMWEAQRIDQQDTAVRLGYRRTLSKAVRVCDDDWTTTVQEETTDTAVAIQAARLVAKEFVDRGKGGDPF